jgi:hypothetical protein
MSEANQHRLELMTSLEVKSQEIQTLELKSIKQETKLIEELKLSQENLKNDIEKKDQMILQLQTHEEHLLSELKDSREAETHFQQSLEEEKEKHSQQIKEIQEKHSSEKQKLMTALKISSTKSKSLNERFHEAKKLDQLLLAEILREESLEHWNFMRFRDDKILEPVIEHIIAKKAIIDVTSLMKAMDSLSKKPNRKKATRFASILEDLMDNFLILPDSIKREMSKLMEEDSLLLLLNESVKNQYNDKNDAWKKSQYDEEDELDLNRVIVPKKIKCTSLERAVSTENETIIECFAKKFLQYLFVSPKSEKNMNEMAIQFLKELKNVMERQCQLSVRKEPVIHEESRRSLGLYRAF